ncbi:MAG: hypothetical protein KF816_14130 [Melioribacteraceae bacterium]|jgi:hypothetical protein|nr:hypothetical protein [Melioribacteraceae bacterium]
MELQEEITSFVDGQLNDKYIALKMKRLIDCDQEMRQEYVIQKSIKNLLTTRFMNTKTLHCPIVDYFRKNR